MSNEQNQSPKYVVHHAVQSTIGDYATTINNIFSPHKVTADPGMAELQRLFEQVNERLAALPADDQEQATVEVEQAAKLAAEIQQGDESEKKQAFLETRLKNLYAMAPDIAQVIITTLASPVAGIALTIQKIAQKAQADLQGG